MTRVPVSGSTSSTSWGGGLDAVSDGDEGSFVADDHWVTFFGSAAIPPDQFPAALLPLALDFGPNRAG